MSFVAVGVGAGAGALVGGAEFLANKQAIKRDNANRPKYQIPPEVMQGLSESERQALQGLPEEQKAQYVSNLQRGQAFSLSQNSSRKGGLSGIAALNENANQGYANLLSQDSAARYDRQKNVYGQLNNVADQKAQQWDINVYNPFNRNSERNSANRGQLFGNITQGASLGMAASNIAKRGTADNFNPSYGSDPSGLNFDTKSNPFSSGNASNTFQ